MPRIAVAVGVLALTVFSIGFNTARYSAVWEMVGASPRVSQPCPPAHPAPVPGPTALSQSDSVLPSTASWRSSADQTPPQGPANHNSADDSRGKDDGDDEPAAAAERKETGHENPHNDAPQPADAVGPPVGRAARVDPAKPPAASASVTRVVGPPAADGQSDPVGCRDLGRQVRRLPPVDQVVPFLEGGPGLGAGASASGYYVW